MIYESHLAAAESAAWPLATSVAWEAIDREIARGESEIHRALHDAALVEGYLPLYASRLMAMVWDDVDATAVLSLELYEGLRHYTALTRYLALVGFAPDAEAARALVAARARARDVHFEGRDVVAHLTTFMCSELFAAYFFLRLSRQTREPVLRDLLGAMSRDEFRHSAAGSDLLRARIDADPSVRTTVLAAAEQFRHYGADVVDVPIAEHNDFEAIMAMNRNIRLLCGVAVADHLDEE